ncbi:unnamed protein product [Allacma fusca]|uniref:BTB domain-containing protein n=1 Tax=Allacma fusca TaxID=39272 RepID=A0A8J2P7X0_9HEXA|nr:unnamed protein product [Allacma fusca]
MNPFRPECYKSGKNILIFLQRRRSMKGDLRLKPITGGKREQAVLLTVKIVTEMESAGGMAVPAIPFGLCYGEEAGCDIIFLAGRDDDIWRLPAHKFLLTRENPVFNAMLSPIYLPQETPSPHTIRITDVDGRALDNLLRSIYGANDNSKNENVRRVT